ncbi:DNA polymerase/3'-5' exonuclease PolX [subsurface metagenome]
MKNREIAQIFYEMGEILEIKGDNPFKIRAYYKAAQNMESLTEDIERIVQEDRLNELPGIGVKLALKIKEYVTTGKLRAYEKLKKKVPSGLIKILSVPGVGPKTAKLLYEELKIDSIEKLKKAAKEHKISQLPHLKEKTEENILRGIEIIKRGMERMPLGVALPLANEIVGALKKLPEVKEINPAGSLRRKKETIGDIDILITSTRPAKVMDVFTNLPCVSQVIAHGETKSSILTKEGIHVDVRVLNPRNYGAALQYFTGSKEHNIALRTLALKKGLKISEYGIFNKRSGKRLAGEKEEDIYKILGLSYIEPELRENQGEIEAAKANRLPKLIEESDIRGDLHIHSNWSDGSASIEKIVEAARKRGWEYVAICDHSKSLKIAGGLSDKELKEQIKEIRKLNKRLKGFRVLAGIEVDILKDGTLDYSDELLRQLDFVVAAIHSGFKQSREQITKRIVKACENRWVDVIAHPTGRLLGERAPYEVDLDKVIKVAKHTGTFLEINAYPKRLDLNDIHSRKAKEGGVKISIGTDAHTLDQLDYMTIALTAARRGWLEKKDVLNTLPVDRLLKKLKRNK